MVVIELLNPLICPRNIGKKVFFIEELYYGIGYHQLCLRLPPCHHLKIYILILIDFLFCTGFAVVCFCFVTVFCCNYIFVVVFLCVYYVYS